MTRFIQKLLLLCLLITCAAPAWASTTNYAYSASTMPLGGNWTAGSYGGHNYDIAAGYGSDMEFVATGTSCTIQMDGFSGITYTITVDGGTPVTGTATGSWGFVTCFTGLSDGPHTVVFKTGGSSNQIFFDTDNTLQVTGAAPAVSLPAHFGTQYNPLTTPFTTYGVIEGPVYNRSAFVGYPNVAFATSPRTACIRLNTQASEIWLWMFQAGQTYIVRRDGVLTDSLAVPNTSTWGWWNPASGLDTSASHTYEIICTGDTSGYPMALWRVMLVGSGLTTTAVPARPTWLWMGDSITWGNGWGLSFPYLVTGTVNAYCANAGVAGTKLVSDGTTTATSLAGMLTPPTRIFVMYGRNDSPAGTTLSQFQTGATSLIITMRTAFPTAPITWLGTLPWSTEPGNMPADYLTAEQAAVAGAGSSLVTFASVSSGLVLATDTVDGTHPTDALNSQSGQMVSGTQKVANNVLNYLNPPTTTTTLRSKGSRPAPKGGH